MQVLSHDFYTKHSTLQHISRAHHLPASMPVSRKFAPRYMDQVPPLSLLFHNKSPDPLLEDSIPGLGPPNPKPGMKPKVKAQRRARSPRALDPGEVEREAGEEARGAAHRARKKSYKPPDVRTIFEERFQDPRVTQERGEGHTFVKDFKPLEWCDVCCKLILQDGEVCTGCKYACHTQCRDRVTLDCHQNGSTADGPLSSLNQDHLNNNQSSHNDVEKERELRTHLSVEEIRHKIKLYNAATQDHLKMTLNHDGLYTGFIKVQLELRRPITVTGGGGGGVKGQEAFYLPRGCVNTLHISSSNTVRQVIEALLRKFTVADNPAKFALYKRFGCEDHVCICKLAEGEHPLFLRLLAGPNTDMLSFVLREQQTGEVMWDAFSIPELHNFLRILDKEEQDQVRVITTRYNTYREKLEEAMRALSCPD